MSEDITKESVFCDGLEEMYAFGARIAATLKSGAMIGFQGPLGAGKTSLIKGISKFFGIDEAIVVSPSYTIMHEYVSKEYGITLNHWDLYRLNSCPEELMDPEPRCIHLIEWPEKGADLLDYLDRWYHISLEGNGRRIRCYQATT